MSSGGDNNLVLPAWSGIASGGGCRLNDFCVCSPPGGAVTVLHSVAAIMGPHASAPARELLLTGPIEPHSQRTPSSPGDQAPQ